MPAPINWLPETQTNTGAADADYALSGPQIIGLSNGNYLVVWGTFSEGGVSISPGDDIIAKIYDANGNVVVDSFQINNVNADDERTFIAQPTNDGGFILVYSSYSLDNPGDVDIIWQRHNAAGLLTHSTVVLQDSPILPVAFHEGFSVSTNLITNETIVTYDQFASTIMSVRISANGNIGSASQVSISNSGLTRLNESDLLSNGNSVSVYSANDIDSNDLVLVVRDGNGNLLNTETLTSTIGILFDIEPLSNGGFVVMWGSHSPNPSETVFSYQIFEADGSIATASPVIALPGSTANLSTFRIAALPQGGFVVAAGFYDPENDIRQVFGQLFDNDGVPDGDRTLLRHGISGNFSIDATGDGRILFTFNDDNNYHSIWDPRETIIDAADFVEPGLSIVSSNVFTTRPDDTTLIDSPTPGSILLGQGGDDILVGVDGVNGDQFYGGNGNDTLDNSGVDLPFTVTVNLDTGLITNMGPLNAEQLGSIENYIGGGSETIIGSAVANVLTGGAGANVITGGAGDDDINGLAGDDILSGDAGNDVLNGGANNDTLNGGADNDILNGDAGADTLNGDGGNDTLDGGIGIDVLNGGNGDDVLIGGDIGETLNGGNGTDLADFTGVVTGAVSYWTLASGYHGPASFTAPATISFVSIENFAGNQGVDNVLGNSVANMIAGNGGDDWLRGVGGNDVLLGGAGNDLIDGGLNNDTMTGGLGDDIYYVDSELDVVTETSGEGVDEVRTTVNNYTLGAHLDDLRLQGGATNGAGNALANTIIAGVGPANLAGLAGDDVIFGSGAADVIDGGTDNDFLYGRNGNDQISGGSGDDTIRGEIGSDVLNGNDGNDLMFGDEGADTLNGGLGDDDLRGGIQIDTLYGGEGADTLRGEDGNDNLYGGAGRDFFTGGAGNDGFYFENGDFSGTTAATADRITDFEQGADRIRLNLVDAIPGGADNAFAFIGANGFTNVAGQLRYQISGSSTMIYGDFNGDGVADFAIALTGVYSLVGSDFVL